MLASRQRGHVTRGQLLSLGIAEGTIFNRVQSGRLHRVYPGIYAVGHPPIAPMDRAAAAVLACGEGALLSHFSAAALWGWTGEWREPFEVTVPGDRRPRGIRAHRRPALTWRDRTRQLGIPVTSPARTVLDCAPRLSDDRLGRLIDDALRGPLSRDALAELLERCPRQHGARRLRPFAYERGAPTRSHFERRFRAFARRFALPRFEMNVLVGGREVDVFFRAEGLIIELDGYKFHGGRGAFERDRNYDVDALVDGIVTVRLTWERMTGTPEAEAARLHAILHRRREERDTR